MHEARKGKDGGLQDWICSFDLRQYLPDLFYGLDCSYQYVVWMGEYENIAAGHLLYFQFAELRHRTDAVAESGSWISDIFGNDQFCSVFVYEDEKHGFIFGSCVGVLFLAGVCNVCISRSVGAVAAVPATGRWNWDGQ